VRGWNGADGTDKQHVGIAAPGIRASGVSRLDRRKARTRKALVDAAVRLIAEGRGERASIQEITEAADIGFGCFYNHFESKDQLFRTASEEFLERWGQMMDRACAGIDDPAEVFATSFASLAGSAGPTRTSPDSSPPRASNCSTSRAASPLGHCATSRTVNPPGGSPASTRRSPSPPWPAA
jgi:AcrR family transcriptional regulator